MFLLYLSAVYLGSKLQSLLYLWLSSGTSQPRAAGPAGATAEPGRPRSPSAPHGAQSTSLQHPAKAQKENRCLFCPVQGEGAAGRRSGEHAVPEEGRSSLNAG